MTRVATSNSYGSVLSTLMRFQDQQLTAQNQVASGKLGSDLKAFARNAQTLTATNAIKTRIDGFVEQSANLANKLDAQDLALNQMMGASSNAREAVANALATGGGISMVEQLQSALNQVVQGLNSQYGGRYLFAGGQVGTPPLSATSLDQLVAAPAVTDLFTNDDFIATERLDETSTVKPGILADEVGAPLLNVLKAIKTYADANGGLDRTLTPADQAFLQSQLSSLDQAHQGLVQVTARNGLNQKRVEDSLAVQEDRQVSLKALIGDLTAVDMAEATTRLSQVQLGLQAGAQIFTSLRDYSLLNFLAR